MSIRIKLSIKKELHLDLFEDGIKLFLHRIMVGIRFIDFKESFFEEAIFDTGSPITIIPFSLWKKEEIDYIFHKNKSLFGFGQSKIEGKLAYLRIIFADEENISPILKIKGYLINNDKIPLIIGMEDIINKTKINIDEKKKETFLEF